MTRAQINTVTNLVDSAEAGGGWTLPADVLEAHRIYREERRSTAVLMAARCALCVAPTAGRPLCRDCWNVLHPRCLPDRLTVRRLTVRQRHLRERNGDE